MAIRKIRIVFLAWKELMTRMVSLFTFIYIILFVCCIIIEKIESKV